MIDLTLATSRLLAAGIITSSEASRLFREWKEEDHPRADDGKFGSGGGGASSSSSTPVVETGEEFTKGGESDKKAPIGQRLTKLVASMKPKVLASKLSKLAKAVKGLPAKTKQKIRDEGVTGILKGVGKEAVEQGIKLQKKMESKLVAAGLGQKAAKTISTIAAVANPANPISVTNTLAVVGVLPPVVLAIQGGDSMIAAALFGLGMATGKLKGRVKRLLSKKAREEHGKKQKMLEAALEALEGSRRLDLVGARSRSAEEVSGVRELQKMADELGEELNLPTDLRVDFVAGLALARLGGLELEEAIDVARQCCLPDETEEQRDALASRLLSSGELTPREAAIMMELD